jgi:hypothetical protein
MMFGNFRFRLVQGFGLSALCLLIGEACSSSGGGATPLRPTGGSGGTTTTSGGSSGANTAAGAASGGAGNAGGSAVAGSDAGGAVAGGTSGGSALGGNAGVSGFASGGSAGSGGAIATCTPGTGTTDLGDNVARDNKTCLVWQKAPTCTGTWEDVEQCCLALPQVGGQSWRMPTVSELETWVQPSTSFECLTCPAYIAPGAGDPENNFEFFAVTTDSAVACAHRGQATTGPTFCVSGQGVNVPMIDTETTCSPACGRSTWSVFKPCLP